MPDDAALTRVVQELLDYFGEFAHESDPGNVPEYLGTIVRAYGDELAAEQRERDIETIRRFLLFNSQRAVSWHEVQDCIEAIRAQEEK